MPRLLSSPPVVHEEKNIIIKEPGKENLQVGAEWIPDIDIR